MKFSSLQRDTLLFCLTTLLILFLGANGFCQNNDDLPELNELPLDSNSTPSKSSVRAKDGNENVEELYQTYAKPEATADGYVYDPVGRRDPFRPFRDAKVGIGQLVVKRERPLELLENFDVKSLQVVAIIWGISKPKALIEDPNKIIHTVVKGMRIGKNDGVVAEIREGEVVVVELFDQNGKIMKEPFILPMRK